uniref:Short-chain dehydrogenase/reductase 3 n=2 Tax=Clytia hemisphaerica TaxID=252671 RepID=A0A7M5UJ32_9CNID
ILILDIKDKTMSFETLKWYVVSIFDLLWTLIQVIGAILIACVEFFYVPPKDLTGEIVVLTGAAGDIGSNLAKLLANDGCKMVLLDINKSNLLKLCHEINKTSGNKHDAISFACDITNIDQMKDVCGEIKQKVGDPTMLVNNAGIVAGKYFHDLEYKDFVRTFEVNMLSNFFLVKQFLPAMIEKEHGHVVSVSSILARKGLAGVAEYAASKSAVATFMESLRYEIQVAGKKGINCTTVYPYQLDSNLFKGTAMRFKWVPFLHLLKPEYVAEKIYTAIKKNQVTLYIPRILYFLVALQNLLPERANDILYNFLQANEAMKTFCGTRNVKKSD